MEYFYSPWYSKPAKFLPGTFVKDEEVHQEFRNKDKELGNYLQGLDKRISKNPAQLPEEHLSIKKVV